MDMYFYGLQRTCLFLTCDCHELFSSSATSLCQLPLLISYKTRTGRWHIVGLSSWVSPAIDQFGSGAYSTIRILFELRCSFVRHARSRIYLMWWMSGGHISDLYYGLRRRITHSCARRGAAHTRIVISGIRYVRVNDMWDNRVLNVLISHES